MKHFILLLITVITITALAQPVPARDTRITERAVEVTKGWGGDYDPALAQPATARDTKATERAEDIIRNWGGEYD